MPHPHRQFPDAIPGPPQQQYDFRLGIVFRVPVSECQDDPAIGGPEPAGAVGKVHADQDSYDSAKDQAAELADEGLSIPRLGQKPRSNDQIDIILEQMVHEPADLGRSVLSVSVHLNGQVVPVQRGISVAGLHRPADAQIERQAHDRNVGGNLTNRVVGRTIIHHEHVELRQCPAQSQDDFADRCGFVEDGNDDQAAFCRGGLDVLPMRLRHIWVARRPSVY